MVRPLQEAPFVLPESRQDKPVFTDLPDKTKSHHYDWREKNKSMLKAAIKKMIISQCLII